MAPSDAAGELMAIGELATRAGISVSTARAWERRYGLLRPERSAGGHRRYGEADLARVRAVLRLVSEGWNLAAAAGRVANDSAAGRTAEDRPAPAERGESERRRARKARADGCATVLRHIEQADPSAALHAVLDLVDEETDVDDLIVEVLGAAQRQVGTRWEKCRWSVAQEHAATAVVSDVLASLVLLPLPRRDRPPPAGHMVVACVEGESHALPALMAAAVLRLHGWEVTFLGPSVPAEDLGAYLEASGADAVGLSSSLAFNLTGARRSIASARESGLVVVTGGRGFGPRGRYGLALGADLWISDPRRVAPSLRRANRAGRPRSAESDEAEALEAQESQVVEAVLDRVRDRWPGDGGDAPTREHLRLLVRYVESALVVGDEAVLRGGVTWLGSVATHRGVPQSSMERTLDRLPSVLVGHDLHCAAQLVHNVTGN